MCWIFVRYQTLNSRKQNPNLYSSKQSFRLGYSNGEVSDLATPMVMGTASDYLTNLPSRGLLSSTVLSSNLGGMRVYICEHDTSPPEDQVIKTNQTNILIRSLNLKNQKNNKPKTPSLKDTKSKTENVKGKRVAERTADGNAPAKRANLSLSTGNPKPAEGSRTRSTSSSSSSSSKDSYQTMTVERLRTLLKERGLTVKGKKDELIARLRDK
ncbi:hypothetical protein MKX01_023239 [Papaver californicum]|nr:hypothetical protein MKX01_023239 [Papaver californicum]